MLPLDPPEEQQTALDVALQIADENKIESAKIASSLTSKAADPYATASAAAMVSNETFYPRDDTPFSLQMQGKVIGSVPIIGAGDALAVPMAAYNLKRDQAQDDLIKAATGLSPKKSVEAVKPREIPQLANQKSAQKIVTNLGLGIYEWGKDQAKTINDALAPTGIGKVIGRQNLKNIAHNTVFDTKNANPKAAEFVTMMEKLNGIATTIEGIPSMIAQKEAWLKSGEIWKKSDQEKLSKIIGTLQDLDKSKFSIKSVDDIDNVEKIVTEMYKEAEEIKQSENPGVLFEDIFQLGSYVKGQVKTEDILNSLTTKSKTIGALFMSMPDGKFDEKAAEEFITNYAKAKVSQNSGWRDDNGNISSELTGMLVEPLKNAFEKMRIEGTDLQLRAMNTTNVGTDKVPEISQNIQTFKTSVETFSQKGSVIFQNQKGQSAGYVVGLPGGRIAISNGGEPVVYSLKEIQEKNPMFLFEQMNNMNANAGGAAMTPAQLAQSSEELKKSILNIRIFPTMRDAVGKKIQKSSNLDYAKSGMQESLDAFESYQKKVPDFRYAIDGKLVTPVFSKTQAGLRYISHFQTDDGRKWVYTQKTETGVNPGTAVGQSTGANTNATKGGETYGLVEGYYARAGVSLKGQKSTPKTMMYKAYGLNGNEVGAVPEGYIVDLMANNFEYATPVKVPDAGTPVRNTTSTESSQPNLGPGPVNTGP